MRQDDDLAGAGEVNELGPYRRFMLEDVQSRTCKLALGQCLHKCVFINDLASSRIDQQGIGLHQCQSTCRKQVKGRRSVRTIDRNDVHARQHLVKAFPIDCLEFLFRRGIDPLAVVIMDRQPKCPRSACHCRSDPAHANDAEPLAPDTPAQHPGRRPAIPFATLDHLHALGNAA